MTLFHFWHSQSKKHVPRDPFSFLCLSVCPRLLLSDCVCAPASVSHIISVLKQASFHLFTSFSPSPLSYCQARTCRLISISFFPVSLSLSVFLTHSLFHSLSFLYYTLGCVFFSLSFFRSFLSSSFVPSPSALLIPYESDSGSISLSFLFT